MRKCVLNCSMGREEIVGFPFFYFHRKNTTNYLLSTVDFVVRNITFLLEFYFVTKKNPKKMRVRAQNRSITKKNKWLRRCNGNTFVTWLTKWVYPSTYVWVCVIFAIGLTTDISLLQIMQFTKIPDAVLAGFFLSFSFPMPIIQHEDFITLYILDSPRNSKREKSFRQKRV